MKKQRLIRNYLVLGLMVSLFVVSSCRKYEDGPTFSLASKKQRISRDWNAELIARNSFDVMNQYGSFNMSFDKGGSFTWTYSLASDSTLREIKGNWELGNAKTAIKLEYQLTDTTLQQSVDRLLFMDIQRLTGSEMWLEYIWESDDYRVHLRN